MVGREASGVVEQSQLPVSTR